VLLLYYPAVLVVASFVGAVVAAAVAACERFSRSNMSSKGQTINRTIGLILLRKCSFFREKITPQLQVNTV